MSKKNLKNELKVKFGPNAAKYPRTLKRSVADGLSLAPFLMPIMMIEPVTSSIVLGTFYAASSGAKLKDEMEENSKIVKWTTLSGQRVETTGAQKKQARALQEEIIRLNELCSDRMPEKDLAKLGKLLAKCDAYREKLFTDVKILDAGDKGASATEITFLTERPKPDPKPKSYKPFSI